MEDVAAEVLSLVIAALKDGIVDKNDLLMAIKRVMHDAARAEIVREYPGEK